MIVAKVAKTLGHRHMSFRPRISIVFEYSALNGGENSMLAALDQLARTDFEFVALAPPDGPLASALSQRGIQLIPLIIRDEAGKRLPQAQACEALLQAARQASPDLLHANSLSMGRLTGRIASELAVPCVAHLRDIVRLSSAAIDHLNQNRLLIAVSQATRDYHEQQGIDSARTRVLYNGVDVERFQPRAPSGALRQKLGIPTDAFVIATIGQVSLRKGQDILAEAAARLTQRIPEATWLIVGERHSEKPETVEFESQMIGRFEQAGLLDKVHRLGRRNDIPHVLNEIDLLAHPARQEPFGRVLLEASASGTPIVATDVGGTSELLIDGQSARLIPPDDPRGLADAIAELHSDAQKRARFARAARERVLKQFTADRAAMQLASLWQELFTS